MKYRIVASYVTDMKELATFSETLVSRHSSTRQRQSSTHAPCWPAKSAVKQAVSKLPGVTTRRQLVRPFICNLPISRIIQPQCFSVKKLNSLYVKKNYSSNVSILWRNSVNTLWHSDKCMYISRLSFASPEAISKHAPFFLFGVDNRASHSQHTYSSVNSS
jgi:hypothetical protein